MPSRSVALDVFALFICRQLPPCHDLPAQPLEGRKRLALVLRASAGPARVMPPNRRLCAVVRVDQHAAGMLGGPAVACVGVISQQGAPSGGARRVDAKPAIRAPRAPAVSAVPTFSGRVEFEG